jgi:hypothetical protein
MEIQAMNVKRYGLRKDIGTPEEVEELRKG